MRQRPLAHFLFSEKGEIMIIDGPTGIELIPGNGGKDCPGNGENGNEICCDECNYLCCCLNYRRPHDCDDCVHIKCPRNVLNTEDNRFQMQ